MKKTLTILVAIFLFISMTPGTTKYLASAEETNNLIESISVDKSKATVGDTIELSVKLVDASVVNYIDAWYVAPVTKNDIHVFLTYNKETGLFEGSIPIYVTTEAGNYSLSRMSFYEAENNIVDLFQSELFKNGNFLVTNTNGAGLLENVSVDKSDATVGDTVKLSVKLADSAGVGYIDAWYVAPVTFTDIHVSLSYNSETGLYEGSLPIQSISEAGDYHLVRMAFYGGGNIIDIHQSELFQSGDFNVSGTNGEGFIDSFTVNKREATAGDVVKVSLKVTDAKDINYILLWYTSPITYKTIYVYLYKNSDSGLFEAPLSIDSGFELGDYNTNRLTIYSNGVIYDYMDRDNKLENGFFSVYKDVTPPNIPTVDDVTDQSTSVTGTAETGSTITVMNGTSEVGSAVTQDDGTFSVTIDLQKAGTTLTVTATDESGNVSDLTKVTVKDDTPPSLSTVNEVTDKSTSITGIAEAGSKITVNAEISVIGTTATEDDGTFTVLIALQKAGTKLIVTATDNAGNVSETTRIIVKDATAPAKPEVIEVTDKDTSVTGKAEAGSTVEVKVNGSVIGNGTAGEDGQYKVTIATQKAATELVISAADIAGNVSETTTAVVRDVTSPEKPVVNEVTDKDTSVTVQAEVGSKVEVKVNGSVIGSETTGENGQDKVTIAAQKAGTQLVINATDKAGNVSEGTTVVVIDVTAPEQPIVNEVTDKDTTVTGQAESGSKVEVKVNGSVIGTGFAGEDGHFELTIPTQKAGTELVFCATDKAENVSEPTSVVVKDITAPGKPVVNQVSDKDTTVTGKAEAGSTTEVKVNGSVIGTGTAGQDGQFKVAIRVQKAGTVLAIIATDSAGNQSEGTTIKVIDKTPPSVLTIDTVSDKSKEVTGKTEAGVTLSILIGTKIYVAKADTNGNFKKIIPAQKAGTKLIVTAKDTAGNVSVAKTITILDKKAPVTPTVSTISDQTKVVTGKAEAGTIVTVDIGTKRYIAKADAKGNYKVDISIQKAGTKLKVTAKDAAGNISIAKNVIVIDKTAPSAPKIKTAVKSTTKEVAGTAEAYSTIMIKVGKTVIGTAKVDSKGNFKVKIKAQKKNIVLSVTATDKAKNISKVVTVKVK